jgi:PAS domain S-box-containing protein
VLENAKLLTSELTSNAVRHGPRRPGADVTLRAAVHGDALRIEVSDEGSGFRPPAPAGVLDVGGWGLVLVDRVADRWGVKPGPPTTVWFELDHATRDGAASMWPEVLDPLLLDALHAAVIATDLDGVITRWNRHAEELFGFDAREVIGRNITDILVADGDEAAAESIMERVREGESWEGEWLAPRKDGGHIWVRIANTSVRDQDGSLIGMIGVSVDISERKTAELALAESEERLEIALDAARMGTWDWDLASGTVRWSESLERIHGLEPGSFGGTFEDFQADVHPEDHARVLAAIEQSVREGGDYAIDYRIVRPDDGAVRWLAVRGRVLRDAEGRATGIAGVCVDISDRKDAERSAAVQYAVARVLSAAPSLEDATPLLAGAIGEALGWEVGTMWRVDTDVAALRFVGGWTASPETGSRFLRKSGEFVLEPGVGLPGRILRTARPAWIPDVATDDNFPRALFALEEGLHAAFGFPITFGAQVLGVMEFFSRRILEPDERLLELMAAIGAQLGQYLERQRAETELIESEARKTAVLESALEAIITMGDDGRIVEMNSAAADMFGRPREEAIGRELAELIIPPALRDEHRKGLERYRATGRGRIFGRRLEFNAMRADGSEFPVELTVTRVELPGPQPALFTGYVRDITHRRHVEELQGKVIESERAAREQVEKAHERVAFLADASMLLASSLDLGKTLSKIARLVVPRLADWCSIHTLAPDGTIRSAVVHHPDPDKVRLAREYERRYPATREDPGGAGLSIRSGEPQLYPEITPDMLEEGFPDPDQRRILLELGVRSAMIVPLEARGRALGSITFASSESGRSFGAHDLELAHDLARRAALAIDNARLYEERSHIARTLQRSLLPRRLPEIEWLEVAALYQPAGIMRTEVGGDFYDVFEAGDGVWGVVVGDVCGKGAEAAALTGMARHTIRGSTLRQTSPRGALEDLNRVMLREDGERFCTVALGRVETTERAARLTVACGGHPLPFVLRRRGKVETIGAPGSLLGVFEDVSIEDRSTVLKPGDLAVFFTDGLVDSRHPTPLDDGALRALVQACAGRGAQETVDRIAEAVADPSGQAPDDICVVVLRVAE